MGYTKDYRVKYHYAHPMGQPDGKPVNGVYVAGYRELAFSKAEEIMRQGEHHNIPVGVEVIHINPDNGGHRSVIAFHGQPITKAIRWEVALYPSAVGKANGTAIFDRYEADQNEIDAREAASNFARTDQGVATIYRVVKGQREQVAVIVPPHRDEIAEAHRINDALDAEAATARAGRIAFVNRHKFAAPAEATLEPIGWEVHYEYRDLEGKPTSRRGKITGRTDKDRACADATRIMRLGGYATLKAVMPDGRTSVWSYFEPRSATPDEIAEANAMNEAFDAQAVTEVAPAPVSAESWAADVQAAAKLAETLGSELGTSLARLLDQVAFNAREGRTPVVAGELAVCISRVADAVTATAERNAALPRVLVNPDRTLAAIEREPEHVHGGRFRVTNGGRYQPEHVADWDELGVI